MIQSGPNRIVEHFSTLFMSSQSLLFIQLNNQESVVMWNLLVRVLQMGK